MNIIRNQARACAFILAALATTVNASTVGTTGPATVNLGDSFDITITGDFLSDGLIAGGLDLFWDNSLVSLNSVILNPALGTDPDLSCPGSPGCTPDTANSTLVVWGQFLSDLIAPNAGPTLMATLSFTANAAGSAAFSMLDNPSFTGGWFGAGFSSITAPGFTGNTVDINAIPVPAAVWLFGSGLLGLVGVARRRKAA